jgi:hypothetical protein
VFEVIINKRVEGGRRSLLCEKKEQEEEPTETSNAEHRKHQTQNTRKT